MSIVVCRDGKELGIREAVDYLERMYGIPPAHIRCVTVTGGVNMPVSVTVDLIWQEEEAKKEVTEVEVTQFGDPDRVFMRSDGTVRHESRGDAETTVIPVTP